MKIFPGLSYSLACQARTKIWVWSVLLLSIKHPQRINFFFLTFFCLFTLCCYIERERKKSQGICTAFSPYYVHFHFFFITFFCIKQVHLFPFLGSLNIDLNLVGISEYFSLGSNWQTASIPTPFL